MSSWSQQDRSGEEQGGVVASDGQSMQKFKFVTIVRSVQKRENAWRSC